MPDLSPGATFTVAYPFVLAKVEVFDEVLERPREIETWNPGVRWEPIGPEDSGAFADGLGAALFEVVSVHKPGRYPTRVFFSRKWRDPDGKTFGKTRLHIATLEKFRRLIEGYQHEYEIERHLTIF